MGRRRADGGGAPPENKRGLYGSWVQIGVPAGTLIVAFGLTYGTQTLGHFLEQGFANHHLRAMVPNVKVIGRAATLKLGTGTSAFMAQVMCAGVLVRPGDIVAWRR